MTTPQKVCVDCGGAGPFRGRRNDCRACESKKSLVRRKNRVDEIREYNRQWRENNPEKVKEHSARSRAKPGQKQKQAQLRRAHYFKNTERYKEQSRQYRKNNPRKRTISVEHCYGVDKKYAEIVLKDPCSYCGAPSDTVDHIDPISKGGENTFENFTGACRSCNSRKYNKGMILWLAMR